MRLPSKLIGLFIILSIVAVSSFLLLTRTNSLDAEELPDLEPNLANGEIMFWAGGCGSCHAGEGAQGEEKKVLGGGLQLNTDFGTFNVPNISPDRNTGIGNWSKLDFVNAMKLGVAPGGKHLYPAFPYTSYQRMTLADILDLKAYLDTLPAVTNIVKANELNFPYNVRRALGIWKILYLDGDSFKHDNSLSEEVNRGKYLVEGPAHCGECHTPRNFIGGPISSKWLAGAPAAEGDGFVPNITPSPDGIGDWSIDDIAYSLESGFTPEFDSFGGTMVSVQENMAKLPASDRQAISAYLKTVEPKASGKK